MKIRKAIEEKKEGSKLSNWSCIHTQHTQQQTEQSIKNTRKYKPGRRGTGGSTGSIAIEGGESLYQQRICIYSSTPCAIAKKKINYCTSFFLFKNIMDKDMVMTQIDVILWQLWYPPPSPCDVVRCADSVIVDVCAHSYGDSSTSNLLCNCVLLAASQRRSDLIVVLLLVYLSMLMATKLRMDDVLQVTSMAM